MDGIREAEAVPAIQLNHAGRKGFDWLLLPLVTTVRTCRRAGGWPTMAPSEIAFGGFAYAARCPWMRFMVWSARSPWRQAVRWPPASKRFRFMPRMAI